MTQCRLACVDLGVCLRFCAVEATGKSERRRGGKLPPRVVAYLVMALALFAEEDYEEVAARLAGTFADWDLSWARICPESVRCGADLHFHSS
jgi:hypothetical protein